MAKDRRNMKNRVVPVRSTEAGDSRVGGTPAEHVALVEKLSEELWARTRRPLPTYTPATMPINVTTLGAQADRD